MNTPDPKENVRITWTQLGVLLLFTGLAGAGVSSMIRRLDEAAPPKKIGLGEGVVPMIGSRDPHFLSRLEEVQISHRRLEDRVNKHLDKGVEKQCKAGKEVDEYEDE
jgi:hypothetical protein